MSGALATTRLLGSQQAMAGGSVLLSLHDRVAFGGAGWVMLGRALVDGEGSSSTLDFRASYGGLVVRVRALGDTRRSLSLGALLGAGNGKTSLPAVHTLIAADNFGVLIPQLTGDVQLSGLLHAQATLGYRWAFGVQDLPGVSSEGLRGLTARIGVALTNF